MSDKYQHQNKEPAILNYCYNMDIKGLPQNFMELQKQVNRNFWISVPQEKADLNYDGFIYPFLKSSLIWQNNTNTINIVEVQENKGVPQDTMRQLG
jgi:hypothetical protein